MSKITFRADDDLVEAIEGFDASKSEVMRRALRTYLDRTPSDGGVESPAGSGGDALERALAARVERLVGEYVDEALAARHPSGQDVNVNLSLETPAGTAVSGATADVDGSPTSPTGDVRAPETDVPADREPASDAGHRHDTGGETASDAAAHCGQCGEPVAADHVFCPNCGEKTSRRVFCECGDEIRSDWSFCPGCGTRTPAADVLDRS